MRRCALVLALCSPARAQPMGEPISEILMFASDAEFDETVMEPTPTPCWAVLFVRGEDEQLPSVSLLEVISTA